MTLSAEDRNRPVIAGVSIVVLGRFNPTIFQPQWFGRHGLLPDKEVEDADVEIVHPNATVFALPWLGIQVTQGKFFAMTQDPTMSHAIRDLVLSTFKILEHTPLGAIGLNRHLHFPGDTDRQERFRAKFMAGEEWNAALDNPTWQGTVVRGARKDKQLGRVQIKLEPSVQIDLGIFVDINEHFVIDKGDTGMKQEEKLDRFLEILDKRWIDFLDFCDETAASLVAGT